MMAVAVAPAAIVVVVARVRVSQSRRDLSGQFGASSINIYM